MPTAAFVVPRAVRRTVALAAILTIALTVAIRLRLLSTPLERDEGEYAYAGQLILSGALPYQSAYNMKLPGAYYVFAAAEALFGQTDHGIHLALVVVNLCCCAGVFGLARRFLDVEASSSAAAAFALLSVSPAVLGTAFNAEHAVLLCAIPAAWCLVDAMRTGSRAKLAASGLLFGAAIVMKQHAILLAAGGAIFAAASLAAGASPPRARLGRFALFAGTLAAPYAAVAAYFAAHGALGQFWFLTSVYARAYVSIHDVLRGMLRTPVGAHVGDNVPLSVLGAVGLVWILAARGRRRTFAFVLVFAAASLASVYPGFYFRPHYFVLVLPAAALLCGAGVAAIARAASRVRPAARGALMAAVALAPAAGFIAHYPALTFAWTPEMTSRQLYPDAPFVEIREVAAYIDAHSTPTDTVANVGAEPELLFYARRRSASGFLYCYPLIEPQPYAAAMRRQWFDEIERARPRFAVFSDSQDVWTGSPGQDDVMRWWATFREGYEKVGVVNGVGSAASTAYFGDDPARLATTTADVIEVWQRR